MASDLPLVRLGDYVDACLGKMLDAQKNRGKLQPYLGNSNVRWGAFDLEDLAVMRFEEHEDERYGIRDGDLIVCEGGEPGRCAIWRGDTPMKIQKALHRVRTKNGLDNHFLYYWFLQAGRTGELEPFFTGTTIKHLTGRALAELRIPLLPIESQREVAKVLRSLDAKIDLNHRINQTLEAMAQAIFQSWFVDFDPVKAKIAAKAEGRDPLRAAMSAISGKADAELDALPPEQYEQLAATAALFPDEMEESELGEIPKCWRCETFGTIAELSKGSVNPLLSPERVFEHYSLPAFDAGKQPVVEEGVQIKSNKTKFARGAVLQSKLNPHIPRVWFPLRVSENAVCSTEFLPWIAKEPASPSFVYCLLTSDLFGLQVRSLVTGTSNSHQRVKPDQVSGLLTVVPSDGLLSAFTRTVTPFFERIESGTNQIRDLAGLRDVLLPKLLSGELQVQHTEPEAVA